MRTACPWAYLDEGERAQFWATLALRHTHGLGARSWTKLLQTFGTAYAAIEHLSAWGRAGIAETKAAQVASGSWRTTARQEWDRARHSNACIVLWHHAEYPALLRQLPDAPALLYCQGDVSLLSAPAVAVVGARRCTAEGVRVAGDIARELSRSGVVIVSGMAQGIDRVAHQAALAGVGKSIGVLGTGIDVLYPPRNADLYSDMREAGLIVTEFAPGSPPCADNFPVRNRIISGLSLGVLVVEAALRSGSLITARLALEQNRDVFAIPGPASAQSSRGCQELVRQGARPVFNADDILRDMTQRLQEYGIQEKKSAVSTPSDEEMPVQDKFSTDKGLTAPCQIVEAPREERSCVLMDDMEKSVVRLLIANGTCHVDNICAELGLPAFRTNALLTAMEVSGKVTRLPGARYEALTSV